MTVDVINKLIEEKNAFAEEVRNYLIAPLGVIGVDTRKLAEVIDGIKIQDITSLMQDKIGITVLKVFSTKDLEVDNHIHDNQAQTIFVIKGQILDMKSKILFKSGASFFTPKSTEHTIKYYTGTEAIIVYMPALDRI